MKCLIALALVAVAAADSDSFYPGYGYQPFGFQPYSGYGNYNPYLQQGVASPFLQHPYRRNLFKRDADSDSDSFYPGYPFVPPTPYYGQHYGQQTPFFGRQSPYMHQAYGMPFAARPMTTYSHPMMYNPIMKVAEQKKVQEHQMEKRSADSDSDSFYPGYGYMGMNPYTYGHPQQMQMPYHQTGYGLPSVVPRVLPYNFAGFYGQQQLPYVQGIKPFFQQEKKQKEIVSA